MFYKTFTSQTTKEAVGKVATAGQKLPLRTNCLLDFVHRPGQNIKIYKNIKPRRFGRWLFFRLQVLGGETPT
jgi:hypothetical protein